MKRLFTAAVLVCMTLLPRLGSTDMSRAQMAEAFRTGTEAAYGFREGTAGPLLYVYFDPNCIYCHVLYEQLEPLIQAHRLQVYWIPVGFLKPSSLGKAVRFFEASNPVALLALNEDRFDTAHEEGGIPPDPSPVPEARREADQNEQLLASLGTLATPTLVFLDRQGRSRIIPGVPQKLAQTLAEIAPR